MGATPRGRGRGGAEGGAGRGRGLKEAVGAAGGVGGCCNGGIWSQKRLWGSLGVVGWGGSGRGIGGGGVASP